MARKQKYGSETQQTTVRIPVDLIAAIDKRARKQNSSRAEVIMNSLRKDLAPAPAEANPFA